MPHLYVFTFLISLLMQVRVVNKKTLKQDKKRQPLPAPKIAGINCVGLVWEAEESLTIWLVYQLPSTPADTLSGLLEAVATCALEYPRVLVLRDFSVHADRATSVQATDLVSSMAAPGLSQFV